jgi:molybdate transport system ATP-binding protein
MELKLSVSKALGTFKLDADITLSGDHTGIFGTSGSGKSTLVSLISGLQQPDHGSIILDGETLFDSKHGINIPAEHRRIGLVFQYSHLFPHLSVKDNLLFGYKRTEARYRKIDFDSLVEVLQIGHLLSRGVSLLSGGEKQRVAIGRAVLSNPRLLLLDEPLSALDDSLRFQIIKYLKLVCRSFNIPYLFISHSVLEMQLMTDQVLTVANGAIIGLNSTRDLARLQMGISTAGYRNILTLAKPIRKNGLYHYGWGGTELVLSAGDADNESTFELSSNDIILMKQHPEFISARNLIKARVSSIFEVGNKVGIELSVGEESIVATVVKEAANELAVETGNELFAVFKASAFRMLG